MIEAAGWMRCAECRVCGRVFSVRLDGRMRRHRAAPSTWSACAGSLLRYFQPTRKGACGPECNCREGAFRESDRTRVVFSTGQRFTYDELEPGVYMLTFVAEASA